MDSLTEHSCINFKNEIDDKSFEEDKLNTILDELNNFNNEDLNLKDKNLNLKNLGNINEKNKNENKSEKNEKENILNNEMNKICDQDCKKFVNLKVDEEGEVDSGDELEEGEVKDDDEDLELEETQKSYCKFYSKGACIWGDNCRFVHQDLNSSWNRFKNNYQNNFLSYNKSINQKCLSKPINKWETSNILLNEYSFDKKNESEICKRMEFLEGVTNYDDYKSYFLRQKYQEMDYKNYKKYNESYQMCYNNVWNKEYERKRRLAFASAPYDINDDENTYNKKKYKYFDKEIDYNFVKNSPFSSIVHEDTFSSSCSDSCSEKSREDTHLNKKNSKHDSKNNSLYKNYESKHRINTSLESSSSFFTDSDSLNNKKKEHQSRISPLYSKVLDQKNKKFENEIDSKKNKSYKSLSINKNNKTEAVEKKPIKITFKKRHNNLKTDHLKGPRNEFQSSDEEDIINKGVENDKKIPELNLTELNSKSNTVTATSRKEILKQLKAIEDAIARKRAK